MKQCVNCDRLLSGRIKKCIYCSSKDFKNLSFESSSLSKKFTIYSSEIIVDGHAYTILKPLGKGGFGTVIKVMDSENKDNFAMKVPLVFDEVFSNNKANKEDEIELSLKYLENEINTILKFKDETYLYIYKKGTAEAFSQGKNVTFPVYLMELAEGTVKELMKYGENKSNNIPYEEKVKIIRETVNAISHLHSMNVIHRDLSPDNIFIVDRGARISYVLGDFGASKRLYNIADSSKSTKIVGHSAYLDPSRFEEKYRYDLRADVYSLGIIITEILIGKSWIKEFGEENISHLVAIDFEKEFLRTKCKQHLSDDLIKVISQSVKRKPEDRFESIDDFRKALFNVLDIDSKKPSSATDVEDDQMASLHQKKETISFEFSFQIRFPIPDLNKTFAQDVIKFKNQKELKLTDFRGAKIVFPDFKPEKVKVKNTSLYTTTIIDNSILLNFKNSQLNNLMDPVKDLKQDITGDIDFKGTIEAEGLRG